MAEKDIPAFRTALQAHLDETGEEVTALAKRAGVSRDALYKVLYGKTKSPSLETIIRVARAHKKTVEEFMGLTPVQAKDELIDEISRLRPSERAVLQASLTVFLEALRSKTDDDAEDEVQGE